MKDKENWVNMYVYKHAHIGNRTSDRAESAHASLKHSLGTSSGKLKTVTLKVADRKHWLMVESLGEGTKIVFDKVNATRLNDIRLKVCRFAMDQIKLELSKSIIPEKLAKECKCLIQYNYLLPCYHTLAKFDTIPISCIPRRWRKNYLEGENHLTIQNATPVPPNINNIKPITPEFNYALELICEHFANAQSEQEQINIYQLIEKTLKQIDAQKLENLKGQTVVEAIKGRPKNTKRKMVALKHCINTKKEKITKKIKTEKEQKKQKISSAKEQKAIKNIINLGSPCDPTLLTNLTIAPKHISTIFSPEEDGNCGYRAIAMEVYQDQEEWSKVKDKMLETFLKHQNNYYHGRIEHGNMPASNNPLIRSLQDKRSPLPQQHWLGTIDHPQLVTDTFSRAVAVYWNTPIETGDCLFVPFATLPEKVEPIIIILDCCCWHFVNVFSLWFYRSRKFKQAILNIKNKAAKKKWMYLWRVKFIDVQKQLIPNLLTIQGLN
ncbi:hypothetical protein PHYBLDRAFT_166766 [Phycomyces blakesleeanus NRRL 1555(-)]|uniref:OTU domain-containing protein n=1 Tax=Phycomyces blakesleeanus (strain ATCC 8743b / DSM 1359 / FGSC 10004 / NBRC 33097 / NRRL 1555) TaxID=763407 RepID=A0A167NAV2_PHYB8|nr:hypothetical protein PHYBLDRAFT_166766 [Phycomyces blakesleeanus NRRL 1555(-)]OAD75529.1 hypothetical protein PHYBLDRAFT_166766 [Phycomyces blakesleeanus NRRL 1555(-)]|eukprot:XP_018293569.1 hypothetical protein PHYBLDRAFT_166766 [Phycomyces blakesleeanus NRRL 1555(-)]